MEHEELIGDRCGYVRDVDDGTPSSYTLYKDNVESVDKGFTFLLDFSIHDRSSYLVPHLACRQFLAEEMTNQGGRHVHSIPYVYLFHASVANVIGIKEGGVGIGSERGVDGASCERHYHGGSVHIGGQLTDTGDRAYHDIALRPECSVIPGGGGAVDPGVVPAH